MIYGDGEGGEGDATARPPTWLADEALEQHSRELDMAGSRRCPRGLIVTCQPVSSVQQITAPFGPNTMSLTHESIIPSPAVRPDCFL